MINKCNFCDQIENKVFSYLCMDCNNNTNYCEFCNPVMERIFARQFFHCVFCNQNKQIKTINILNNNLNNQSIINDFTENSNYSIDENTKNFANKKITSKNRCKLNFQFENKNPIGKKLQFLENFANHLNKNLQPLKNLNESVSNPTANENSLNSNFGGVSHINPNVSFRNQNFFNNSTQHLNENSPDLCGNSNNISNTFNSLLNAFSPIKDKDPLQQRFYGSARSQSNYNNELFNLI